MTDQLGLGTGARKIPDGLREAIVAAPVERRHGGAHPLVVDDDLLALAGPEIVGTRWVRRGRGRPGEETVEVSEFHGDGIPIGELGRMHFAGEPCVRVLHGRNARAWRLRRFLELWAPAS